MSLKQLSALSVLACTLSNPGATSAADLSVGGRIQSGGACSITLGNGGIFDLGAMSQNDFSGQLDQRNRETMLTLNCQHPTKIGIDVVDNRKGTASEDGPWYFGLGNTAIGHYGISSFYARVDGMDGFQISRDKGSTTWDHKKEMWSSSGFGSDATISWDVAGPQIEPVAFKTLTTTLVISFHPKYDSAFADEREFDGSATLELVYL